MQELAEQILDTTLRFIFSVFDNKSEPRGVKLFVTYFVSLILIMAAATTIMLAFGYSLITLWVVFMSHLGTFYLNKNFMFDSIKENTNAG